LLHNSFAFFLSKSKDLFYQLALEEFANFGRITFDQPASICALLNLYFDQSEHATTLQVNKEKRIQVNQYLSNDSQK
jgi:hypothetical protein